MQTITTIAELDTLIDETPALYARWSHGPDADAANGWISRRWCPLDIYDDEGQVIDTEPEGAEESGLSATLVLGPAAIVQWHGDVYGETCYLLTGNEAGLCSDDEPLLSSPEPIAYVSMDLVNEIYDGLRLGAWSSTTMNTITDPRYGTTLVCDLETDTSYGFQAQYDSITGIITLVSWSDEEDKHESFSLTRENFDRIAAALKES